MIKIFIPLIFIFGLSSCSQSTELPDYFGQTYPDSIPVIFAPDVVSIKGRLEHGISFSPDSREFAFGILNQDDFSGEIYYSKKINDNWTVPMVFEPLKNKCVYLPYFSPNGKSLLFAQSKPDKNNGNTDIWIIEKTNSNWSSPRIIQAPICSISREANASITNDGTIYFSSNRNCEGKENCDFADLFFSRLDDNQYQSAELVAELSLPQNDEESVFISPEEEYLIFCRYTNNETWMDLYISYHDINNNWLEPQIIDSTINSKDWDRRPFVSIDNTLLFFTRLQIGEKGLTESDLYWVNTSKVFKPFVYHPLPDTIVQVGEKFEISLPLDYFKDIDDKQLTLRINQNEYDWLEFDGEIMKLSGLPNHEGNFELTFVAVDDFLNTTEDKVKITVIK
ncbi:hypothetical protein [Marinilabilia sp.]|uniref:hypothetical protein n=1 Tax=Marinilabilia sp. TaxID=2021252 RepID=UPI0025C5A609|nr:hypothetical protein [Marinilabilia sp.]